MFTTLRTKLLIGLTPLLAILVGLGLWAVVMFARLGNNIDVILRENYRSVLAAQRMKEALERMDSAALFAVGGRADRARAQYAAFRPVFEESLRVELGNITLPGERERAYRLRDRYEEYVRQSDRYYALPAGSADQVETYFARLLPTFDAIKREADAVLELNERTMERQNDRARRSASTSIRLMVGALGVAVAVGTGAALVLARSILGPVRSVTGAARALAAGDYDQVVPATTRDELGELAEAFNVMARRLREFRAAGTARLLRAQQTAQATIDSIPDPVVVVDPAGSVERANPAARRVLGVAPSADGPVAWAAPGPLRAALAGVLGGGPDERPSGIEHAFPLRDDGQERFYLPRVLAIRAGAEPLGAAVVLHDVTKFRLVDQLKSDMVSTASHELKTPLTSVQMVVHLLLEEAAGPLTPKQAELLAAARQESDRLLAMVNDLLDLARVEQGRLRLDAAPVAAEALVAEAVGRAAHRARDLGVVLEADAAPGLPPVAVDRDRVGHVFDNLIGNALGHTGAGGRVAVAARPGDGGGGDVRFAVEDTGEGIAPEHLAQLFERFYRVPGARRGGAGLGLAIAREIVAAHGGRIDVRSAPGRGSTFTFTLPAAGPDGPPPSEPSETRP